MPNTLSPNMSLILPTVGQEPSPTWAQDLNASLTLVDQHNHTTGNGVPITPAGLNINTNLDLQSNNLINVRSTRHVAQGSPLSLPTDLNCFYVSGVDAYYNDGNGNQVRLTQSGSIAGTSGSIGGLTSPASATYVAGSQTFVWQSAASTAANMDAGSYIFRNLTVSSNGITIATPSALSSNFTLTLPTALPATLSFLQVDNSGNMSFAPKNALVLPGTLEVVGTALFDSTVTMSSALNANTTIRVGGASGPVLGFDSVMTGGLTVSTPVVATGGVYTNTATKAILSATQTNTVDIFAIGGTNRPIVTSFNPSSSGLIICRGIINSAGSAIIGEGYSSTRLGVGNYQITFSTAMGDSPASVATPQTNQPYFATCEVINTTTVTVRIFQGVTTAFVDCAFSFIIIGQRTL